MATRIGGTFTPSSAFPVGAARSEEPDTLRPPAQPAESLAEESRSVTLGAPSAAPEAPEALRTAPLPHAATPPAPVRPQRWLYALIAALVALVLVLAAILAWVLYTR